MGLQIVTNEELHAFVPTSTFADSLSAAEEAQLRIEVLREQRAEAEAATGTQRKRRGKFVGDSASLPDIGGGRALRPSHRMNEMERLGFGRILKPRSQREQQIVRYLKRIRTQFIWDELTQRMTATRPFEGVIRIGSGYELKTADMFDGSDPYCEVYWNEERVGCTRVVDDDLNPSFNECFRILIEPMRKNTLRVVVYDYDDALFDDDPDFMGEVVLEGVGAQALPSGKEATSFELTADKGPPKVIHTANHSYVEDNSVSGRLELQVRLGLRSGLQLPSPVFEYMVLTYVGCVVGGGCVAGVGFPLSMSPWSSAVCHLSILAGQAAHGRTQGGGGRPQRSAKPQN